MAIESTDKKRILILTSTFPRWEGDREPPFVFELSRRLAREFEVCVLAPHAPGAELHEIMDGIEVVRYRYFLPQAQTLAYNGGILANLAGKRWNYLLIPFFFLAQFFSLLHLLRKTRFDLIHAHWLIPQAMIALAARFFSGYRPTIVCTSHGGDLFGLSGSLMTRLKRHIIGRVDKLAVVSQAMRDYARTIAARTDIEVISMGVDLQHRFTPAAAARATQDILFIGRLVEKKGIRYLIEAMRTVVRSYPQARLHIVGDGPDLAALRQLAMDCGLASQVHFLGPVENAALPERLRRATIFAAPSVVAEGGDQEGLGLVFVEALGCECAVVASDLPAMRDVIVDGVTGLVCRQRDSVDLAGKLTALLDNAALRTSLGQAGRQFVLGRFDWEVIASRYAELLNRSLAERRPSVPVPD